MFHSKRPHSLMLPGEDLEMKARAMTAQTSFHYSKLHLHLLSLLRQHPGTQQAASKPEGTPAPSPCPAKPRPPRLTSVLLGHQHPTTASVRCPSLRTLPCHPPSAFLSPADSTQAPSAHIPPAVLRRQSSSNPLPHTTAPLPSARLTSPAPCPHSAIPLTGAMANTLPLFLTTTGNSTTSHSPSSWDKLAVAKSFAISPPHQNSSVLRSARLMH